MENESKLKDPYGLSRLEEGETFIGNFPIERKMPSGQRDKDGVNSIVQDMLNSGKYKSVRTDSAKNEEGKIIIGKRAVFAVSKL